ncbi:hypothetical protein GUJ93_ZPchr0002g25304 [Zizania palustris]|uniref:(S)-ureidoglycine aminohydrolase cupin domain-containing protein n=1 Tax=Zizania palustris TaxID=103762 RepID=A0A8J5SPT9_ZIZPA|nr:hypothetical protein GUJ93_ZPchr0002g25304 [Zizania palustris]
MSRAAAATAGCHLLLLPTTSRSCGAPPRGLARATGGAAAAAAAGRVSVVGRRPLEEVYKVRVERGAAAQARVEALRVMETWSTWRTGGRCRMPWDWQVDQLVYIVSGEVRVLPAEATTGEEFMHFVAGDLVRYPKWFDADLHFDGPYEERYRFLAYGDDN